MASASGSLPNRNVMKKVVRYDLGFNWYSSRASPFTEKMAAEARRRGMKSLCVLKADAAAIRRQLGAGRLQCGMFLNTQADGANMESPLMLLNRDLKAAGCVVVEENTCL